MGYVGIHAYQIGGRMIKQLMYKWFGLSDEPCQTCEILRERLDESNRERRELLHRLLDRDRPEPPSTSTEEHVPLPSNFTPWRVRQQMLEQEDRQRAKLIKEKAVEMRNAHSEQIDKLEEELGVKS
jgi:hypothetical protein